MEKVHLRLVGQDGNAFALLGAFAKQAKREKWLQKDIDEVLEEAQKGDYDHLLRTLMEHCTEDGLGEYDEEDI